VWLRRDDLERVSEDQLFIEVALEERLAGMPRNRPLPFEAVPLQMLLGGFEVLRVEPGTVNLEVRVVAETIRKRLGGISVDLAASPQIWQRYDIDCADANEWLLELEVEGDEGIVNALRPQDVRAVVPLTSEQALPTAEYRSMDVMVELPAGVTLVSHSPQVRLRLVLREGPTP
jgi:hypothetical protein